MNQDFRNMDLFKISQIIKALPPRRQILQKLFGMAIDILGRKDEPKPILAISRILKVLTEQKTVLHWATREQQALINVMSDQYQFDMELANVRMRINMLACLSNITKHIYTGNILNNSCQTLMIKLLDSITDDLSSLDERPVLELVNTLIILLSQHNRPQMQKDSVTLLNILHDKVCVMAIENSQLVDISFLLKYLQTIRFIVKTKQLDSEKTQSLIDVLRDKVQEPTVQDFFMNELMTISPAIDVANFYDIPELDQALSEKWENGQKCFDAFLPHFNRCQQHVYNMQSAGFRSKG